MDYGRVGFIALNYTGSAIFTPKYGHEISINLPKKYIYIYNKNPWDYSDEIDRD